jgi:hypothetical protein
MAEHVATPDSVGPDDRTCYWGEFHKHLTPPQEPGKDALIESGRHHLDVYGTLCYPAEWYMKGLRTGIREETVGEHPAFEEWWEDVERAAAEHHDPGSFVTLPSYEWVGDRTRWGDHNVFYFEEGHPLDLSETLAELYDGLDQRDALALPHHTGYQVANRGKDWDEFDPDISPVMEVYSGHGSSEGIDTPFDMLSNGSMSPRTSGGTYIDGLDRGLRVGAIASNDGWGLPGTWDQGVAGLWATELTREGVRESLEERRTYGVTGDRIDLWLTVEDHPMGALVEDDASAPSATVEVDAKRRLDRIELIHDGRVVDTYVHRDRLAETPAPPGRYTTAIELGWGPFEGYGDFDETGLHWSGTIDVEGGSIRSIQPRFRAVGNRVEQVDGAWRFEVDTDRSGDGNDSDVEGLVVDFDAEPDATVVVDFDERESVRVPVADLRDRTHLRAYEEEAHDIVEAEFDVTPDEVDNPDLYYHNTPKCKVHAAHAHEECAATVRFEDLPRRPSGQDRAYYYARVSQVDGQFAWSSPVWLTS